MFEVILGLIAVLIIFGGIQAVSDHGKTKEDKKVYWILAAMIIFFVGVFNLKD